MDMDPGFYKQVQPSPDELIAQHEQEIASLKAQKEAEAQAAVNPVFRINSQPTDQSLVAGHTEDSLRFELDDLKRRVNRFLEIAYTGQVPQELQERLPFEGP